MRREERAAMQMSIAGRSISSRKSGFTLFELLVVITILAVMAGVVIPNINLDIGGGSVDNTLKCIELALDQGRYRAKMKRESVAIVFAPDHVKLSSGDAKIDYPGSVHFEKIVFPNADAVVGNELLVDSRGIAPAAIVIMKIDDQTFSFLVSPVLRELEYRKGIADFGEFSE